MLDSGTIVLKEIRVYTQLCASIFKSSYFGLIAYFITILFGKNFHFRVNNIFLALVVFLLIMACAFFLVIENSEAGFSYLKTILLWMLPIIYYALGARDINNNLYEKLLLIMLIYTVIEIILINFTSIALFDSDRLRSSIFGIIRGEGVAHNSSISSALVVSIFLKIYLRNGFSKKFFLITLLSVILLGSGAGILLFIFSVLFFIVNKKLLLVLLSTIFIFSFVFFSQFPAMEILGNIHPKISHQYITFLIDYKYEQIGNILDADIQYILFGFSILDNKVMTSGDFGYLTMIAGIGLIPALILLFGILMMFIRASRIGNFAPFLILMIENIHYPVFIDPIAAYILAQYAIIKRNEK
jgi:hypothetical protein